jgi:hypothetical protein
MRIFEMNTFNLIALNLVYFTEFNGVKPTDLGLRPDGTLLACPMQVSVPPLPHLSLCLRYPPRLPRPDAFLPFTRWIYKRRLLTPSTSRPFRLLPSYFTCPFFAVPQLHLVVQQPCGRRPLRPAHQVEPLQEPGAGASLPPLPPPHHPYASLSPPLAPRPSPLAPRPLLFTASLVLVTVAATPHRSLLARVSIGVLVPGVRRAERGVHQLPQARAQVLLRVDRPRRLVPPAVRRPLLRRAGAAI